MVRFICMGTATISVKRAYAIWPERRSMDASPDTAFQLTGEWRPFSDEEIVERLTQRKGHDSVDHYHALQKRLKTSF